MAKRKISGIINATEHPMNLETPWNQKQPDGTYHAYAGDDIEAFLKKELSNRTPTEELVGGETKPPTSGTVFDAMVGTVTDVDVQDSEDGTQYVMTVKQKDNQGGESSKEVRFSKYTDDDKVVVNIDLTGQRRCGTSRLAVSGTGQRLCGEILRGCGYCRWRYGGRLQRPESPRNRETRFDRDQ